MGPSHPGGERSIRVLVADDRGAVREGLRMWLELEAGLEVVGEAGDGGEAISLAEALRPDVVVMDVRMPGVDGIDATTALRTSAPRTAVVILSLYDDAETRSRARDAGATAFVAKHHMEEALPETIRRTVRGGGRDSGQ